MSLPLAVALTDAHKAAIAAIVQPKALDIERADAHLAALLPPDTTRWEVNLDEPRFEAMLESGARLATSRTQLIATWSTQDRSWLWGDANPSTSAAGTRELSAKLDALPEFRDLRAIPRFTIDERMARELATACAIAAGWAGAWPGRVGVAIALLALDPIVWPGSPRQTEGRMWCSFCGRARTEVAQLVAGPGVYACDLCSRDLVDIRAESSPTANTPPGMPPCLFCGKRDRRIFSRAATICHACVDVLAQTIDP